MARVAEAGLKPIRRRCATVCATSGGTTIMKSLLLALVLALTLPAAVARADTGGAMNIGIQLWSVKDDVAGDFEGTLRRLADGDAPLLVRRLRVDSSRAPTAALPSSIQTTG